VSPFGLRAGIVTRIREVAAAAEAGEPARIRIKINNITDEEIIGELYQASQAGARIDVVARSICTLRPGIPDLSETIRVRSVLGRFLEHSRMFILDAGERTTSYIGSADLMPRNLDNRIDVLAPVEDWRSQQELSRAFDTLLTDNASAWELSSEGRWMKLRTKKGDRTRPSQVMFIRSARARARRRSGSTPRSR
jgi:polyphosphate kinase